MQIGHDRPIKFSSFLTSFHVKSAGCDPQGAAVLEAVPNLPEVANCKAAPQPTVLVVEPCQECCTAVNGHAVVNDHKRTWEQHCAGQVGDEDVTQGIKSVLRAGIQTFHAVKVDDEVGICGRARQDRHRTAPDFALLPPVNDDE